MRGTTNARDEGAFQDMNAYVQEKLAEAVDYENRGLHTGALWALGEGMHPLMDMLSTSHYGYQEWGGLFSNNPLTWPNSLFGLAKHAVREIAPMDRFKKKLMADQLQRYYLEFLRRTKKKPC